MTNDMKILIDEVEKLAEDLALDPNEDAAKIKAAENRIAEIEISLLSKGKNGNAYFPLLERNDGAIPFHIFVNYFIDALKDVLKRYDPNTAKFSTYFSRVLNLKSIDAYNESQRPENNNMQLPSESEEKKKGFSTYDLTEEVSPELMALFTFKPVIEDIKEYNDSLKTNVKSGEKEKRRKESIWFERFYTFDTTKAVKEDGVYAEIVKTDDVNDVLFPLMKKLLLRFTIMFEDFEHMCDVVDNKLRREDILNNYAETISECYKAERGASERSVVSRRQDYNKIMDKLKEQTKAKFKSYYRR